MGSGDVEAEASRSGPQTMSSLPRIPTSPSHSTCYLHLATRVSAVPKSMPDPLPPRTTLLSRALGLVLASAAGDALGAPCELDPLAQSRIPPSPAPVPFTSSEAWERGEWTDDTAMAIPFLEAAAGGSDLRSPEGLSWLAHRWISWAGGAGGGKGIGLQTALVFMGAIEALKAEAGDIDLYEVDATGLDLATTCRAQARAVHQRKGRSAGNGALMRVGPLALSYLLDEAGLVDAARKQAMLTHYEEDAGDAAVLWSLAIRRAIVAGRAELRLGLAHVAEERRELWKERIDDAEALTAGDFERTNTWIVSALQCAWAAFLQGSREAEAEGEKAGAGAGAGGGGRRGGVVAVLEAAVRAGGDTDTIGAIAGALAGAVYGAESVPGDWVDALHGWPGIGARDLRRMVEDAIEKRYPKDHARP